MARRKLIAGNWKMNGLRADGLGLASDLASRLKAAASDALRHAGLPAVHADPGRRRYRRAAAPSPSAARTATCSRRARIPATPAPGC